MKIRIFLISLFIIFFGGKLHAQNWRGVSSTKSNYFLSGNTVKYIEVINSNGNVNGDSVFNFYNTIRDSSIWHTTNLGACVDTNAPTWFGNAMYRNENTGIEKYTNFKNDTIYINTFANISDTWTLTTDTGNVQITATVSQIDTLTIDNVLDSIKKITLQQFTNGI